jgi:hypothetical protein
VLLVVVRWRFLAGMLDPMAWPRMRLLAAWTADAELFIAIWLDAMLGSTAASTSLFLAMSRSISLVYAAALMRLSCS